MLCPVFGAVVLLFSWSFAHRLIQRGRPVYAFFAGATPIAAVFVVGVLSSIDCSPTRLKGCGWDGAYLMVYLVCGSILAVVYPVIYAETLSHARRPRDGARNPFGDPHQTALSDRSPKD